MAQHRGGVAGACLCQRVADRGRRHGIRALCHQRSDGHAEPHLGTEGLQLFSGARARLAKAEVRAHDDMAQAQPINDHLLRKGAGAEAGEGGIEPQLIQLVDADLLQLVRARLCAHQTEGRGVGGEIFAGVWLECDPAQGRVGQGGAGHIDDRPMPQMHPVEIANSGGRPLIGSGYKLIVANDFHALGGSPLCRC